MSNFISVRNQKYCTINANDFYALQKFEHKHPELYKNSTVPKARNVFEGMEIQMKAFNLIFVHPQFGPEFKMMITDIKKGRIEKN